MGLTGLTPRPRPPVARANDRPQPCDVVAVMTSLCLQQVQARAGPSRVAVRPVSG